jgi:hypothetical protein
MRTISFVTPIAIIVGLGGCDLGNEKTTADKDAIKTEIETILKIQEDAYDQNDEEGRKKFATTCDDSLLAVGGDDGGIAMSANFYVHDFADGYSKRPSNRRYRIYDHTVIVTSIYQSFKVFNKDTIYFNARSTKVFVKNENDWKMAFATYAPLPIMYTKPKYNNSKLFDDYAGRYGENPSTVDTISVIDGRVYLMTSGSKLELFPINDSTFFGEGYFGKTVFVRNDKGVVIHNYFEFPDGQRLTFPKIE